MLDEVCFAFRKDYIPVSRSLNFLYVNFCWLTMASQAGIEMNRLRVHRFPDHYVARVGATPRPVSQISTNDQASESAEVELVQPSSSLFAGSDHTIQHVSDAVSSLNDNSPLIASRPNNSLEPDEADDTRASTEKQKAAIPWTLRRTSLLGLITFLVALIVALEVSYRLSNKNQGFVTAKQDATYLWKYLPTASKWNPVQCDHNAA